MRTDVAYAKKDLELAVDYYRKAVRERDDRRFQVALREIEEEIRIREESRSSSSESDARAPVGDAAERDAAGGAPEVAGKDS